MSAVGTGSFDAGYILCERCGLIDAPENLEASPIAVAPECIRLRYTHLDAGRCSKWAKERGVLEEQAKLEEPTP